VARAKRTDRAEARRRYRAQLAEQAGEQPDEEVEAAEPQSRPASTPSGIRKAPSARSAPASAEQAPPSGIGYAFRAAFHSPNYREDIAYLPRLVVHPAVWAPVLATIVTAVAYLATDGRELISGFALQYFVAPPPIGAIFIAGFFAPRASYLAGGIVGIVSALVLAWLTAVAPPSLASGLAAPSPSPSISVSASPASGSPGISVSPVASASAGATATPSTATASSSPAASPGASPAASPGASPAPGAETPRRLAPGDALGYALATSPLSGVFFASAAAWYRRFLRLANPNRGRPPARKSQRRR
jgi:hypothetical protein